ncbi:putative phiE125 gp8 family phage protein [Sinorhizobium fredii]
MLRPVLVTAPQALPVSLAEVKSALRVDGGDSDSDLERLIRAAVAHYDGWSGILGIALVAQTWRQDFGGFEQKMMLGLRPVQSISSVKWRNEAGQISTIAAENYALKTDAGGRSYVRFLNSFSAPSDLYEDAAVSIEFVVGWPITSGTPTTPEDIKTAIILHVQKHYDEAAKTNSDILERVECDLVSKYRAPLF